MNDLQTNSSLLNMKLNCALFVGLVHVAQVIELAMLSMACSCFVGKLSGSS